MNRPNLNKAISNKIGKLAKQLTTLLDEREADVDDIFYSKDSAACENLKLALEEWLF